MTNTTTVPREAKIYLPPADLKREYLNSVQAGSPTKKLIEYFNLIAKNYSTIFKFVNKQDKSAVINFAVSEAWLKWDKYDETRSKNLFSFFTEMLKNDMILHYNTLTKGKKVNISIDNLFENSDNKN